MVLEEKFIVKYWFNIMLVLIAVFWAIVHATAQLKIARDKKMTFTYVDYFILLPIALFAWLLFWILANIVTEDQNIIILCTALWAFLWLAGLNKIGTIFLEFVASQANKTLWIKASKALWRKEKDEG